MQSHSPRLRARRTRNPASCFICQSTGYFPDLVRAGSLRQSVAELLARVACTPEGHVCQACLVEARHQQPLERMRAERGRLTELDEAVAPRIRHRESVVRADEDAAHAADTFGERVADDMGRWGDS